jgi:membrane-associated phospholipid phosphatase
LRKRTQADACSVEDALPVASGAHLADDGARLDLADAADPIPVLPQTPRKADAIVFASCGLAFAVVAIWISREGHAVPAIDGHIHAWVLAHRDSWNTEFARAARWAGLSQVVLPALLVIGTVAAHGRWAARLTSGAGLAAIASAGIYVETQINALINRARPPVADWAAPAGGPSFPSGHTTAAALFAICCAWALMARVPAGWARRAMWGAAALYAAVIGWSRIWLGVHWPTDVVGGLLFSAAWTCGIMAALPARGWRPWPAAWRRRTNGHGRRPPNVASNHAHDGTTMHTQPGR